MKQTIKQKQFETIERLLRIIDNICEDELTTKESHTISWLAVAIKDIYKGDYQDARTSVSIASKEFKEETGKGFD